MANQNSQVIGAEITKRPVLASYEDYLHAQKAVDTLSDSHFPVQHVAIVGVDLRLVESVLGRMSWGRAALSGMATFAWFGVLIGLFVSFFGSENSQAFQLIMLGLLFGAAFGIVFGMVSYAFTGGRRDFVSRQALQAARYDVLCDGDHIGQARQILGLAPKWPPEPPPASASAGSPQPLSEPGEAPGPDLPVPPGPDVPQTPGPAAPLPPRPEFPAEPGPDVPQPPNPDIAPAPGPTPQPGPPGAIGER